jgi:hypothetical protein
LFINKDIFILGYYLSLSEKVKDKFTGKYIDRITKSKSVRSESLTLDSFINLYKGNNVEAIKRYAITDHREGSVLIEDDTVSLKHDSFTKRQKVFKRKKWVDTKPLIINETNNVIKDTKKKII